jgi:hypothetical protein
MQPMQLGIPMHLRRLTAVALLLCASCASGGAEQSPDMAAGDDASTGPGGGDALAERGSSSGSRDSSTAADSTSAPGDDGNATQDSSPSAADSDTDSTPPIDGAPPVDSAAADSSSPMDAGVPNPGARDTGVADTSPADGASCPSDATGPNPSYALSCSGCAINPTTCVLSCTSCYRVDHTQTANPQLQLPCPGTKSVENSDGSLLCN